MTKNANPIGTGRGVLAAWTAFFVLWTLFILAYAEGNLGIAIRSSAIATLLAAAAAPLIWRYAASHPWPERLDSRFVFMHIGPMLAFAAYWTFMNPVLEGASIGMSPLEIQWLIPLTGWRVLGGIWLYLIIAGISYAIRNNERVQQEAQRAVRAEALAAESKLEALRSQLRPHFLFNALHSINVLIERSPGAAQQATERLAELLRYSVRTRTSDFVSLGEEWKFALGYLDMQKIRFGDRILIETEIDPDLKSSTVPIFSLQPLVENAIVHGIESRSENGTIRLGAYGLDGERLLLEVCDDGPGPGQSDGADGSGTGLDTLKRRLQALYSGDATVAVKARAGGGTCASIEVPLQ